MIVQRIQSTNLPKCMISNVAPKAETSAKKLASVCFNDAKVTMPQVLKAAGIKCSGGEVCASSYSIEAPDLYNC